MLSKLTNPSIYLVGCRGVVQLGGPDPWYNWGGPTKVGVLKSFLFSEYSLVVKTKNHCLIFYPHFEKNVDLM